ncbi:hypothetical protein NEUTE2DRAFT_59913, partial [Neurospora tetrasperma FGSC 2509]
YQYIIVVVNRLIKIRYLIPYKGLSTEELVEKFINYIYILYGLPDIIVLNKGV